MQPDAETLALDISNLRESIEGAWRADAVGRSLLGSSNQRIHFLTERYRAVDFNSVPIAEANLHRDGSVTISGIEPIVR